MGSMIESLVEQIEARYADAQAQMSDPEVIADRQRYADAGRSFNQLSPAAKLAEDWRLAVSDAEGAEELLAEGEDPEMRAELIDARERIERLEEEIRLAMVERDPNDDKNVIVEIRGGAGGDEAGIWAGDLYRMYQRYAERLGYKADTMQAADGSYTFEIKGDGAYSVFKFEGGTHRVQRVPETESQGRIHTSTATVAVLPEAEDVEVAIDQNDLQIDVYRSSGPGGQSVNTTDSAVRITHKPTGIVISMQDEKSQLQNRERAMKLLRARLYEAKLAEQQAALSADRRSQVGTGDRAEKIRTYNFPQRRVTDHRIGLTVHNLEQVLAGEPDELTSALQDADKRRRLEEQAGRAAAFERRRAPLATTTVREALDSAVIALTAAGCETPRLDAEVLLAAALEVDRAALIADPWRELDGTQARWFMDAARRRRQREPVAYIVGFKGFRRLDLRVDPRVLVPRPETEHVVEAALSLPPGTRVVDVGTGSGAIALALKDERPDLRGVRDRRQRRRARRRARECLASGARRDVRRGRSARGRRGRRGRRRTRRTSRRARC